MHYFRFRFKKIFLGDIMVYLNVKNGAYDKYKFIDPQKIKICRQIMSDLLPCFSVCGNKLLSTLKLKLCSTQTLLQLMTLLCPSTCSPYAMDFSFSLTFIKIRYFTDMSKKCQRCAPSDRKEAAPKSQLSSAIKISILRFCASKR